MSIDISRAREGLEQMKLRCEAVETKYFTQVSQLGSTVHRERKSLTGRASIRNEVRIIEAPRPITRRALYLLHECAHHLLGHLEDRKPKHVHELEAEQGLTRPCAPKASPFPEKRLSALKSTWH